MGLGEPTLQESGREPWEGPAGRRQLPAPGARTTCPRAVFQASSEEAAGRRRPPSHSQVDTRTGPVNPAAVLARQTHDPGPTAQAPGTLSRPLPLTSRGVLEPRVALQTGSESVQGCVSRRAPALGGLTLAHSSDTSEHSGPRHRHHGDGRGAPATLSVCSREERPRGRAVGSAAASGPDTPGTALAQSNGHSPRPLPARGSSTYSTRAHRAQAAAPQPLQVRTQRKHKARSHWLHAAVPSAARTHEEQALDAAPDRSVRKKGCPSARTEASECWGPQVLRPPRTDWPRPASPEPRGRLRAGLAELPHEGRAWWSWGPGALPAPAASRPSSPGSLHMALVSQVDRGSRAPHRPRGRQRL